MKIQTQRTLTKILAFVLVIAMLVLFAYSVAIYLRLVNYSLIIKYESEGVGYVRSEETYNYVMQRRHEIANESLYAKLFYNVKHLGRLIIMAVELGLAYVSTLVVVTIREVEKRIKAKRKRNLKKGVR